VSEYVDALCLSRRGPCSEQVTFGVHPLMDVHQTAQVDLRQSSKRCVSCPDPITQPQHACDATTVSIQATTLLLCTLIYSDSCDCLFVPSTLHFDVSSITTCIINHTRGARVSHTCATYLLAGSIHAAGISQKMSILKVEQGWTWI
jgi:hypothetical protein